MKRYALCVCLLLVAGIPSAAQDFSAGLIPFQSYQTQGFDNVNLYDGTLVVRIPIVSYPQRGQLHDLSLSLVANSPTWNIVCPDGSGGCPFVPENIGVYPVRDDIPSVSWAEYYDSGSGNYDIVNYVTDSTGGPHVMGWTGPNTTESIDATGYLYNSDSSVLTDHNGVQYDGAGDASDSHGNTITGSSSGGILVDWVDSIGRTIPVPPQLGPFEYLYVPVSPPCQTVNYPAPEGGVMPVTFCYSSVSISHPAFEYAYQYGPFTAYLLTSMTLPTGTWSFSYDSLGDLNSVTTPTGGSVTYTYDWSNVTDSGPRVVTSRVVNDGANSNTWQYSNNLQIINNQFVSTETVTDPEGNQTVHVFAGIPGYETETRYYQGSSTLLKTVDMTYSSAGADPFAYIDGSTGNYDVTPKTVTTTWPNGQVSQVCTIYDDNTATQCGADNYNASGPRFYDANSTSGAMYPLVYGSQIETDEYDYGPGAPGNLLRQTLTQYKWQTNGSYLNANLLTLPYQTTVNGIFNGSWAQTSQTTTDYDDPNRSPCSVCGNLTSVQRWLNTGSSPTTYYTYTSYGMPGTMTDPNGNTTTYKYDSTGMCGNEIDYPTPSSGVGQIEHFTCDYNTGLITSYTDRNNQTTSYAYDQMRRPTQISYPDRGQTNFYYDTATMFHVDQEVDTSGTLKTTYGLVDGLGRPLRRAVTNGESGSGWDQVDTCYDPDGRVGFESYPYQNTGFNVPAVCSGTSHTGNGDSYAYYPTGDIQTITHSDGSTISYSSPLPCVTITDEARKSHLNCKDGAGRLSSVTEDPGGGGHLNYLTTYGYDASDNLTSVNQSGQTRGFGYDSLSRLTSATNPESGQIIYTYDANGNVLTKTDARGITTTMSYDALNRPASKTYTDGTPPVYYYYDQSAPWGFQLSNPIGRLTSEGTWNGTSWITAAAFGYDPMGRRALDDREINGTSKTTNYSYNLLGSVSQVTYPSGTTVSYLPFNAGNHPTQAIDTTHSISYVTNAHYAANGSLCSAVFGSAITTTWTFNSRLQPQQIQATTTGAPTTPCSTPTQTGNVLDLTYNFNPGMDNGNVAGIANNGDGTRSQTFGYDNINRIFTAQTASTSGSNCWGESYGIDQWSNLYSINPLSGYSGCTQESGLNIGAGGITAANQFSGSLGYQYDSAGNLIFAPNFGTYGYNAEDQLISVAGQTYTYDADGNRAQKSSGTIYWPDTGGNVLDESDASGNVTNEYIYFGGKRVARRVP